MIGNPSLEKVAFLKATSGFGYHWFGNLPENAAACFSSTFSTELDDVEIAFEDNPEFSKEDAARAEEEDLQELQNDIGEFIAQLKEAGADFRKDLASGKLIQDTVTNMADRAASVVRQARTLTRTLTLTLTLTQGRTSVTATIMRLTARAKTAIRAMRRRSPRRPRAGKEGRTASRRRQGLGWSLRA